MWKLVGLLILIFGLRWWSQKIFFLAPPSGQNPKLKFPFTWILAKPEVTKWPEMKPEVSYRLNLSRNFLEWVKKASMSHIFWLIIMIKFCLWPMNFRMSFLSSRRRYSKTDFRIVFLMSFFYLGKLLTICRNGRSHDGQVITSGWSKLVLETHVCTKMGWYGYQNDSYCLLSSFPILSWYYPPFVTIFRDF